MGNPKGVGICLSIGIGNEAICRFIWIISFSVCKARYLDVIVFAHHSINMKHPVVDTGIKLSNDGTLVGVFVKASTDTTVYTFFKAIVNTIVDDINHATNGASAIAQGCWPTENFDAIRKK